MAEQIFLVIALTIPLLSFLFFLLWLRTRGRLKQCRQENQHTRAEVDRLTERFAPVLDIEKEVDALRSNKEQVEQQIAELRRSYSEKKKIYDRLLNEVAIFDEMIGLAHLGIYRPHFEFSDSQQFRDQIERVRAEQKALVSGKTAIECWTDWAVGGSKREGQKMTGRAIRLSLRAFNNECESAVANTRWNNVTTMENRIHRAYDQINKLNESLNIHINERFLDLKLKELWLTHEYREKQKEERDHKAELSRLKREEERLIKESAAAEKEEKRYQMLLAKAMEEAEAAVGPKASKYEARIAELTRELEAAHEKTERAKSMAEQTRAGHIYVISNIGSFGDGIYKIGMTRRLDPVDRIRELGDASVPFLFDTHAIIYCEDAPAMEKALHTAFDDRRVNKANGRKEFFSVSLEEIEREARKFTPNAEFITNIEAQEYRETLAMSRANTEASQGVEESFPNEI